MRDKCCRSCDGRGHRLTEDRENVFRVTKSVCGACSGTGRKPEPSKGRRRFAKRTPDDEDDNNLDRAADKFLARHGFGRNGR